MTQQAEHTAEETLTVTIDGREIQARPGELVIAAAERNGVYVPRFCWHPRMKPVGMCRMCLVEIDGVRGLPPSCTTPVADGMVVHTESPAVKKGKYALHPRNTGLRRAIFSASAGRSSTR